jgi:DNA topoisomerase-1
VQRGDDRASVPEGMAPDELTVERATELLDAGSGDRVVGVDPDTGLEVTARAGRYGPYVQLGEAEEGGERPRTASLFKTMSVGSVTLDEARRLLSLPRVVGTDPEGEEITALNGRYGPYLKRGADTRSLAAEEDLFTVTLEQALAILAEPKRGRNQRAAAAPLRELGADPESGGAVVLREGRFGPYVTDGTTNASLRKGDSIETIDIERAAELLAERRAAGPPAKRGRKAAAKKATKKTTAKKPTAKKAAAKKTAAKKTTAKTTPKNAAAEKTAATKTVAEKTGESEPAQ